MIKTLNDAQWHRCDDIGVESLEMFVLGTLNFKKLPYGSDHTHNIGMNMIEDGNIYLVCWPTDLLSDLQASMLSWFRFQSRVNSSLTKHTKSLITDLHSLKPISKESPDKHKTPRYSYYHTLFKDILRHILL